MRIKIVLLLITLIGSWFVIDYIRYNKYQSSLEHMRVEVFRGVTEQDLQNIKNNEKTQNKTGNVEGLSILFLNAPGVAFADNSVVIGFQCANAGSKMKSCKTNQAAVACAQMACQLGKSMSVGERVSMQQQYDIGMCSNFETACGFDGPDGGGGGGGDSDDDHVRCHWYSVGCRWVHTGRVIIW